MNVPDGEVFPCAICCHDVGHTSEIYQMESCYCRFCQKCVRQYCDNQVNIGSVRMPCPTRGCNGVFSLAEVRSLLTDSRFNLHNKRLLNHEIANDPHRFFCPHADCDQILTVPDECKERPITCPKCQNTVCLQCHGQWHSNERCPPLLTLCEKDSQTNIKHCPQCRFPLEWVAGCAQIVCMNCKHTFCWYCLKSLENDLFLLHYESGSCRNRLGHSRASLFLHRLAMVGLLLIFVLLLIIASPLLLLMLPCLICHGFTPLRSYFNKLIARESRSWSIDPELQSMTPITSSADIDQLGRFTST